MGFVFVINVELAVYCKVVGLEIDLIFTNGDFVKIVEVNY